MVTNLNAHAVQVLSRHMPYSVFLLSDGMIRLSHEGGNAIDVSQESNIFKEFSKVNTLDKFLEFMENTLSVYQISEV